MAKKQLRSYEILNKAFQEKKKKSSGFSIRMIAQKLNISHSYLSRVLQGKKALAPAQLNRLCPLLEIDEVTRVLLEKSLIAEGSQKRGLDSADHLLNTRVGFKALEQFEELRDKEFFLHDEWYYIPVLDLAALKGFQDDPSWIAKKLGITKEQAKKSLEVLTEAGHLKKTATGLKKNLKAIRVPTVKSLTKVRAYHKQMMLKAIEELTTKTDEVSFQKRLISGICISANSNNIPKARQIIQAALHEAAEVLMDGPATDLIQLNVQLFSLLKE